MARMGCAELLKRRQNDIRTKKNTNLRSVNARYVKHMVCDDNFRWEGTIGNGWCYPKDISFETARFYLGGRCIGCFKNNMYIREFNYKHFDSLAWLRMVYNYDLDFFIGMLPARVVEKVMGLDDPVIYAYIMAVNRHEETFCEEYRNNLTIAYKKYRMNWRPMNL